MGKDGDEDGYVGPREDQPSTAPVATSSSAIDKVVDAVRRRPLLAVWLAFAYGFSSFVVLFCLVAPESWFVWNWLEFK